MDEKEHGYTLLCAAVILQACKDYIKAKALVRVSDYWKIELKRLEEFFSGGGTWSLWAGNIDPQYILARINRIKGRAE